MYLSSFPECILTEQLYPEFIRLAVIGNETNQTNTSNGCAVNHDAKSKSFQSQTESNVATVQPVQSTHVEQLDYQKHNHNLNHVPAADKTEASQLLSLRDLIQRLPPVNRSCLRKLLGHFVCVLDCADLNGSSPVQLAAAIAPILIYSNMSASVCRRLGEQLLLTFICHYAWLFDVRPQELEKERKIQQTLLALRGQKSMNTSSGSAAAGGSSSSNIDMLVGVYVHDRAEGSCVNVPLSSNTTADDLLAYVIRHARLTEPPAQLAVFEVVADEQLQRPLHYSESVLELVLGWASNWPSDDAKGNYLIVRPNQLFEQLQPHLSRSNTRHSSIPLTLFNELRFSDLGAGRSFRRAMLELFETRCNVYKDAKTSKTLASWQLHECFWYIGCETKRAPPTKFCITFVARHQPIERSKETHGFVGRVFACSSQEELHKWIAGLIAAQHPNGVQPIIHSLNLLD